MRHFQNCGPQRIADGAFRTFVTKSRRGHYTATVSVRVYGTWSPLKSVGLLSLAEAREQAAELLAAAPDLLAQRRAARVNAGWVNAV